LETEPPLHILKIPAGAETDQIERLRILRARRDQSLAASAIMRLSDVARTPDAPLMEPIIEAVEAHCTVGEMSDALRAVWGEYRRG
jgi:methylmalonyl-CoA mutase N-terminal domain/subunit